MTEHQQQQQQHGELLKVLQERYNEILAASFGPNLLQNLRELHEEGMSNNKYAAVYTESSQLYRMIRTNINLIEIAEQAERSEFMLKCTESMRNGTYLDRIEDVWVKTEVPLADYNPIFIRLRHVEIGEDKRYEKTVDEAIRDINSHSVASQSARSKVPPGKRIDVCNNVNYDSESAHLLPDSNFCGKYWDPVVPLVLHVVPANMEEKEWYYFKQKCIHGSKINGRKVDDVGIKHFPSNRIRLSGQKMYMDTNPCVLIIPILTAEDVNMWNGNGYDAIILAGDWNGDDDDDANDIEIKAADAYIAIKALDGISAQNIAERKHCFAEKDDCEQARMLLEQMIYSVCTASINNIVEWGVLDTYDSTTAADDDSYARKTYGLWSTAITTIIENNYQVPIPSSIGWVQDKTLVRKISFSSRNEENGNNPAPDPVLLVAKAASNWLKRQYLPILPGCSSDYDSTDSDDTVSFNVECARRGWTDICTTNKKNAKVEGIDIAVNTGSFETFSDIDSLSD